MSIARVTILRGSITPDIPDTLTDYPSLVTRFRSAPVRLFLTQLPQSDKSLHPRVRLDSDESSLIVSAPFPTSLFVSPRIRPDKPVQALSSRATSLVPSIRIDYPNQFRSSPLRSSPTGRFCSGPPPQPTDHVTLSLPASRIVISCLLRSDVSPRGQVGASPTSLSVAFRLIVRQFRCKVAMLTRSWYGCTNDIRRVGPAMDMQTEAPEWLVEGARVVLYSSMGLTTTAHVTRIKKIYKRQFSLELNDERYNINTQSKRVGGTWGTTYHVVPVDSKEGRRLIAAERVRRAEVRARHAFDQWNRDKSEDARLAVINAFVALAPVSDDV